MIFLLYLLCNTTLCLNADMVDTINMHITFKKLTENDIPLLYTWLEEPHVRQWWPTPKQDEVIEHFLARIRSKDTFGYMVYANDISIGYIQYYYIDRAQEKTGLWLPELPETTVGTDQFIGDLHYIGKGYGTFFIKEFINYLRTIEPKMTTIIVDPDPANLAAIKCYEKVGFKREGTYTTPFGPSLLMRYDIR